jgi:hypothetical protein
MTITLPLNKENIQRLKGHLGQDYFHDFGSTRADKYYYSENIENNDENIFRFTQTGGTLTSEDYNNKTILEIELEKALDLLNIHPDSIFERDSTINHTAPQQYYTAPQQYYTAPQQYYTAPQQYYTAPAQYYTAPQQYYSAPQQYYTAPQQYYTAPQYYTVPNYYPNRQISNPLPLPQKLSDPVTSPSEPNQNGGVPIFKLHGKTLQEIEKEKEKAVNKKIKKQRLKKSLLEDDEKFARRLQEEFARNPLPTIGPRRTYRDTGPPTLPTNSDEKFFNWDSNYDHYFEKNPNANTENETRKGYFNTWLDSLSELADYHMFVNKIEEIGIFFKCQDIVDIVIDKSNSFNPYKSEIFREFFHKVVKLKRSFKEYIDFTMNNNRVKYPEDTYPLFGIIPKLDKKQRDKVKVFNKLILQYWGNLMGNCTSTTYEDKLQDKLKNGSFSDNALKTLFLGEYEGSLNIFDHKKREDKNTNKDILDEIKSRSPGNNIDVWNDNNNLTNNSCALKYPDLIELLANRNPPPCSLSSSLDGQPSCRAPSMNDPFHLIITDHTSQNNHIMEFGLEYVDHLLSDGSTVKTYKITFNIYSESVPHQLLISHTFISQQLTDDISEKTGFYTDPSRRNLYFHNSSGSGLTIQHVVKLFCLILVNNKGLNPWELDDGSGSGFRYYPNVFSSIFFLKECGDLFQEISACIKSQSGYHNYLTNDIPSILRYFLLMELFGTGNGFGAWVHNSIKGVAFLLGIFESTGAVASPSTGSSHRGGSKIHKRSKRRNKRSNRKKKTRRKKTRRKKTRKKIFNLKKI